MNIICAVNDALSAISFTQEMDGVARISTHCMYPSNSLVSVFVRGGENTFVVTDDGGAIKELTATGIELQHSSRAIDNFVSAQGANYSDGVISSPFATLKELPAAILLIANVSKELAYHLLTHTKIRRKRDFKDLVHQYLSTKFERQRVEQMELVGESNKPHKFENVIILSNERKLIIDPVIRDPASINARVVANMDIRSKKISGVEQRIIYDDEDESWPASDINLLSIGATTIPFSKADSALEKFYH